MSKATGARFGALAFMVVGIAIGYIAAKGGFSGTEPATAQTPDFDAQRAADAEPGSQKNEAKAPTLLAQATTARASTTMNDDAPINKHLVDEGAQGRTGSHAPH